MWFWCDVSSCCLLILYVNLLFSPSLFDFVGARRIVFMLGKGVSSFASCVLDRLLSTRDINYIFQFSVY